MARIQVPASAFKEYAEGDKLITQTWHSFEITKVEDKISKGGDSMNTWVSVKCLTPEFSKRNILPTCFNEKSFEPDKAKYQVIPFVLALDPEMTVASLAETGITLNFDSSLVGKQFDGRIKHEEYNGRFNEKLNDFAPVGTRVGKE